MKKTFTKLFVAFLALLLAPNSLWAFEINSETTDAACKTQFGNSTSLNTSGTTAVLSFGESYNGTTLDLVINSALDIQIAEGLTVNLQSLTCNAPVTVYGGGTLNISSASGNVVTISEKCSFTIGKAGQEAPMNVNVVSEDEEGCCIAFDDMIEDIAFTVYFSNVTFTGNLSNSNGMDPDDEYPLASYQGCSIDFTADPVTITVDAGNSDAVGDVFYTETTIGGGTLTLPYRILSLPDGDTPGTVALGDDSMEAYLAYTGTEQIDLVIPTSVTHNNNIYTITDLQSLANANDDNFLIDFIKSITFHSNVKTFGSGMSFTYLLVKTDDDPGLETVTFADDCDQSDYVFGENDWPFMCAQWKREGTVELIVPESWTKVSNEWGGGNWTGTKVSAPAIQYGICINYTGTSQGIDVTSSNCTDILGDGGNVTYDPDTQELTLKTDVYSIMNGNYDAVTPNEGVDGLKIIIPKGKTVNISSVGVESIVPAIIVQQNTIITGGGTLNVSHSGETAIQLGGYDISDPNYPIELNKNLTIKDVTVNVNNSGMLGYGIKCADMISTLTINNATVHLENVNDAINNKKEKVLFHFAQDNEPQLIHCKITTDPVPEWEQIGETYGYNVYDLTITADEVYGILVFPTTSVIYESGGVEVTSANAADVLGDGKVSYNAESKTLTLAEGAQLYAIENGYYSEDVNGVDGLIINIASDVTMGPTDEYAPYALFLAENTIITGEGTLTLQNYNDAILFEKDLTVNNAHIIIDSDKNGLVSHNNDDCTLTLNNVTYEYECQDVDYYNPISIDCGLEPVLLNCNITNPTSAEWNESGFYDVPEGSKTFTITASGISTLTAEVQDGSNDNSVTVDLELVNGGVAVKDVKSGDNAEGAVEIPASVTVSGSSINVVGIADNAFQNQTGLTSIKLPRTVTSIGADAFAGCTGLTNVKLLNPIVPTIAAGAFDANANLTVNYPAAAYTEFDGLDWEGVAKFQPTVMQPNEWGTIYSSQGYALAQDDDIEAYFVVGIDYDNCRVQVTKNDDGIVANKPMLIRKKSGVTDDDFEVTADNNIGIVIEGEGNPLATDLSDSGVDAYVGAGASGYSIEDVDDAFIEQDNATGHNFLGRAYILIDGTFVWWNAGDLAPYRCFLWATQAFNTGAAPQMGIEIVDGETTGVGDVRGKKDDVRGEWYDLSGRKLQGKPTQKGVYIINGKKVNVK